jgi:hypothetical protein
MLQALNWFPEKLYELYCNMGIPVLLWLNATIYHGLEMIALAAALVASAAYLAYLGWCRMRGYWISTTKIWFIMIAFGTLYLAYVPNPLIQWLAPEWDFAIGFAAIGMVHVSQYLAIVWKYNRNLALRKGACRSGFFRETFARGGPRALVGYVLLCAGYGALLVYAWRNAPGSAHWIVALAAAANFTSTLMHYYYDGFIWKIRHKENQQYLDLRVGREAPDLPALSWWDTFRAQPAVATVARHLLYFGLPLVLLAIGIGLVQADPRRQADAQRLKSLQKQGRVQESLRQAEAVLISLETQLQVERHMIALRPTAAHCAFAAELVYQKEQVQRTYIDPYQQGDALARAEERRREVCEAIQLMEQALSLGGRLANRGFPAYSEEDAYARLAQWRKEIGWEPPPQTP